ncbi:hypothetical protein PYCCODRAFT_1438784, partial [Trametes coccinea BRFM310]
MYSSQRFVIAPTNAQYFKNILSLSISLSQSSLACTTTHAKPDARLCRIPQPPPTSMSHSHQYLRKSRSFSL